LSVRHQFLQVQVNLSTKKEKKSKEILYFVQYTRE